jgi:hypothetical protein
MIAMLQVPPSPPDTATYYHLAYTWAAVLYGGYAATLWRRTRRVRAKLTAARHADDAPPRDA